MFDKQQTFAVWISGKAWNSQAFAFMHQRYESDDGDEEFAKMIRCAKVVKCGKGERVLLIGFEQPLRKLARWFDSDGFSWSGRGEDPEVRADGRACLDARHRILFAITEGKRT